MNDPFERRRRYDVAGLSAEVERLDSQGDPDAVVYRFDVPLENASLRLSEWRWAPQSSLCLP